MEWSEQGALFPQRLFESEIGNLQSRGMNLMEIIAVDLLPKENSSSLDVRRIIADASSNQVVLKPLVRALDLSLGLRGERVDDLDPTILQDLFPLGVHLVGKLTVIAPEGIAALDKAEDGMRIDVVGEGEPVSEENSLKGKDVWPGAFTSEEFCIEDKAGMIIYGGYQAPLFPRGWCPNMVGRVMLDELAGIMGQHLPIMGGLFGFFKIKIVGFGATDDRREGYWPIVMLEQAIFDVAVIVTPHGVFLVLDDFLFDSQFFKDGHLGLFRNLPSWLSPLILDGECIGIFLILLHQKEESAFLDAQDLLDIAPGDLAFAVA